MGHLLLLTYYVLTWHFISLISHLPLLGWMLSAVFTPSFTLAFSLPLKAVLTDVSCGLRRLLFLDPSEAVQHRPQDWAIFKKAGLMVKKNLPFMGIRDKLGNFKQCLLCGIGGEGGFIMFWQTGRQRQNRQETLNHKEMCLKEQGGTLGGDWNTCVCTILWWDEILSLRKLRGGYAWISVLFLQLFVSQLSYLIKE